MVSSLLFLERLKNLSDARFCTKINQFITEFQEICEKFLCSSNPSNRQISNILQLFQILIHWNCLVGSFLCLESLKSHFCWRFSRKIRKILSEIFQFFLFWYSRWPCQKKVAWLRKEQFRRSTVCPSAAQYPKNFYVKVPSLRQQKKFCLKNDVKLWNIFEERMWSRRSHCKLCLP